MRAGLLSDENSEADDDVCVGTIDPDAGGDDECNA